MTDRNERDCDAPPTGWRAVGSGPVALFLHGLGGSRIAWEPQLNSVLADTRRCVAWDAPGYGVSDPVPTPTFDAYAEAALTLIDHLSPDQPVDVVGMSFGGMVAQYLAARAPGRVRTLGLLCTSPKFGLDGTDPDEWRSARFAGLQAAGSPGAAAPAALSGLTANPNIIPEAIAAMERVPMAGLLDALTAITTHDTRHILPTINVPTRVLVGSADDETPVSYAEAMVALLPRAQLTVIAGAGHLLNLEDPHTVNETLIDLWTMESP